MSVVGLLVIKPMSQMGHFRTRVWVVAMSALPRVTDIVQRERNVRKVPRGDMGLSALVSVDPHQYCPRKVPIATGAPQQTASLFDHVVG